MYFFSSSTSQKQQIDLCGLILTAFWRVCVVSVFVKAVLAVHPQLSLYESSSVAVALSPCFLCSDRCWEPMEPVAVPVVVNRWAE